MSVRACRRRTRRPWGWTRKRQAWRRLQRAAAAAGLTVAQLRAWEKRELPEDHPNPSGEPELSSSMLGFRTIKIVERSGVLSGLEPEMCKRRGRKRHVGVKALLVGMQLAGFSSRSYRRSDVCAALAGLHPAVAAELGLADDDGCPVTMRYKTLARSIKTLERCLRRGWYADGVRCDLGWYANAMAAASVPRRIRRSVTAVAVDSTPVKGWAVTRTYAKQADVADAARKHLAEHAKLKNDPFAKHRRDVLEDPDLPEPETKRDWLAAVAKRLGLEVGKDGRIIRGKDRDMRAGWATATAKTLGHFYAGYELTVVVACRSISWQGQPNRFQLGPKMPAYVLAMSLTPAGANPGEVGHDAVMKARRIAPNISEVIADRAYTVKRESFLRPLHRLGINVVMDYPKKMVERAQLITLGRRRQAAYMHCGTILTTLTPEKKRTPPERLSRKGKKTRKRRRKWYAKRARLHRWSTNGRPNNGARQFQCPVHAGRLTTPSRAASASYRSPLVKADELGCCCGGKVTARVEELDFYQEHPYGTRVWQKSYNRRNVAEAAIGKLKAKKGLGGEACQAFGITANTMAAVAAVVAYNRTKAKAVKRKKKAQARRKATAKAQQRSAGAAMRAAAATDATNPLSRDQQIPASGAETPPRAPP